MAGKVKVVVGRRRVGQPPKKTKEWCTEIHSKVEKDAMGTRATNSWHRSLPHPKTWGHG